MKSLDEYFKLTNCPHCNYKASFFAKRCPKCGAEGVIFELNLKSRKNKILSAYKGLFYAIKILKNEKHKKYKGLLDRLKNRKRRGRNETIR